MHKFKIGEIVLIKKELIIESQPEVSVFCGKKAKITDIMGDTTFKYEIDIDGGAWCWCDDDFISVPQLRISKLDRLLNIKYDQNKSKWLELFENKTKEEIFEILKEYKYPTKLK